MALPASPGVATAGGRVRAAHWGRTHAPRSVPSRQPRLAAPTPAASAASFHPTGSGTASFSRPPPGPGTRASPASPLRAALVAAGPAGLATMAVANALFYCTAFALAARAMPHRPGGGFGPALAAVGKAWGVAYGTGLATKAPRSALILAIVPGMARALAAAGGGVPGRAGRLGVGVAVVGAGCVLATLAVTVLAWA